MSPDTRPKPFVFVLMPFSDELEDVYELGIRPACESAGAYCERVDEQIFEGSILQRVYNQIAKADLIVAEMTNRNPNVFYEVGYAHALGKRVVLLTRAPEDIPFDLKQFTHIVHSGRIKTLLDELERRVRYYLENPDQPLAMPTHALQFYTGGKLLTAGASITFRLPSRDDETPNVTLSFDVTNPTDRIINPANAEIGVIVPQALRNASGPDIPSVRISKTQFMHVFRQIGPILPRAWRRLQLICPTNDLNPTKGEPLPLVLRMFTEFGFEDIPFTFRFIDKLDDSPVVIRDTEAAPDSGAEEH